MEKPNRLRSAALLALLLTLSLFAGAAQAFAPMTTSIHLFPTAGAASQSLSKTATYPTAVGGGSKSLLDLSEFGDVQFRVHAKAHTLTANGHHVGLEWQDAGTLAWLPLDANDGGKTLMASGAVAYVGSWSGFDPDAVAQGDCFVRVVHGDGDIAGLNPVLMEVSMQLR